jgi:hypothetical protein
MRLQRGHRSSALLGSAPSEGHLYSCPALLLWSMGPCALPACLCLCKLGHCWPVQCPLSCPLCQAAQHRHCVLAQEDDDRLSYDSQVVAGDAFNSDPDDPEVQSDEVRQRRQRGEELPVRAPRFRPCEPSAACAEALAASEPDRVSGGRVASRWWP